MAKPSRSSKQPSRASKPARRSGSSRRHASRARRGAGRLSWSRRFGLALALILLGASAVLAGQALQGSGVLDPGRPAASHSPPRLPAAPRLLPPANELVASASVELQLQLAEELRPRGEYQLRIYVNGELVRELRLPAEAVSSVGGIPLEQGENLVTAAIAGPAGEGLHSAAVAIVRDDTPPTIHISSPAADSQALTRQVLLRGRSEAGALLSVRNTTNGESHELEVDQEGRFEQRIALAMGANVISLRATDAAGNRSRATLRLTRIESQASLSLEVRPESVPLAELPLSLTIVARVRGLHGEAVDGAQVVFSISVPGQATTTYRVSSSRGVATWRDVRVPAEGTLAGHGLATAMVVLNEGQPEELVLQQSASIRFR